MFVVLCTTTDCQCTVTVTVAGNVASGSISSAVAGGYRIVDDLGDVAVDNRQYNLRKRTKKTYRLKSPLSPISLTKGPNDASGVVWARFRGLRLL
jgi:hypothetical protein